MQAVVKTPRIGISRVPVYLIDKRSNRGRVHILRSIPVFMACPETALLFFIKGDVPNYI